MQDVSDGGDGDDDGGDGDDGTDAGDNGNDDDDKKSASRDVGSVRIFTVARVDVPQSLTSTRGEYAPSSPSSYDAGAT